MIGPVGALLIACMAIGFTVAECNIDDYVIAYKLQVQNDTTEPGWISVNGQDIGGDFQMTEVGTRSFTSYAGGPVAIAVSSYELSPAVKLAQDREFLRGQLSRPGITPAEVQQINDRITTLTKQLHVAASLRPGQSSVGGRFAACIVTLKDPKETPVVFVEWSDTNGWSIVC